MRRPICIALLIATGLLAPHAHHAVAQDSEPAAKAGGNAAGVVSAMPHMTIDMKAKTVDLDAVVVLREADWLELLACTPGGREHESIVTIAAKPSHIHLALITLGLEPGKPLNYFKKDGKWVITAPHGPKVQVSVLFDPNLYQAIDHDDPNKTIDPKANLVREDRSKWIEVPANTWIKHQKTGMFMPDSHWLFTGSDMMEWEGKRSYRADVNGTVISLVNFGDDLLARSTSLTNDNDDAAWTCNTAAIPPVGSKVVVRLRPVADTEPEAKDTEQVDAKPTSQPRDADNPKSDTPSPDAPE